MSADAKKVIIQNITLNVTVIIPITVVAQNAQICISLASSGDQTCQQIILDPTQTMLTPINVDLTEQVPLITSGTTNQTGTTTPTPSNETSSFAGNSNKTFESGKSNITNPSDLIQKIAGMTKVQIHLHRMRKIRRKTKILMSRNKKNLSRAENPENGESNGP